MNKDAGTLTYNHSGKILTVDERCGIVLVANDNDNQIYCIQKEVAKEYWGNLKQGIDLKFNDDGYGVITHYQVMQN